MSYSKIPARLFKVLGAAIAALALMVPMAQAEPEPAEHYKQFAGCPAEDPTIEICMISGIDGGHFKMGSKNVPITYPLTINGGTDISFENFSYNSKGGLTPVKEPVPGGVIGLTGLDWLINFLNVDALKLYAVTELAGPPDVNPFDEPLTLPIKVRLVNPVLGNKCYVGSSTEPINLELITNTTEPPAPNAPITGKPPALTIDPFEIIHFDEGEFVDNSFAAPAAKGCVLTLLGFLPVSLDSVVNSQAGLPSPAGTNETRQQFHIEAVTKELVYP
jgi:hypothetical protein